jgi:hypothetical protein
MILGRLLATVGSVGLVVAATAAQNNPQTAPPHDNSADVSQTQTTTPSQGTANVEEITLAGCLMRHRDLPVPTNAPSVNPAVRHDGFLLVDAMTVMHHQGSNGMRANPAATAAPHDHSAAESRPVVSPTPNVADSQMFKVEGLSAAELERFVGKRVTLMGALISDDSATRSRAAAVEDDHDAAPFRATMIHPASGPCRQ